MKDNGEMARLPDLIKFSKKHNVKIGTIADLISYRKKNEQIVNRQAEKIIISQYGGQWRAIVYKSLIDQIEHLALIKGVISEKNTTMVRVHSFNLMNDVFGELNEEKSNNYIHNSMIKFPIMVVAFLF